ncbi:unnamed protein product [Sphagnum balticum]
MLQRRILEERSFRGRLRSFRGPWCASRSLQGGVARYPAEFSRTGVFEDGCGVSEDHGVRREGRSSSASTIDCRCGVRRGVPSWSASTMDPRVALPSNPIETFPSSTTVVAIIASPWFCS